MRQTDEAPFSKGALVAFRQRLINGQMDRRMIERTIEVANQSQVFGPRALRAVLDKSVVGSQTSQGYLQSDRTCAQKGHERGCRPAGEGTSRVGLWEQLESSVRLRLGSTGAEGRGVRTLLDFLTGYVRQIHGNRRSI
jgi:hypothetical protein